MTEINVLGSIGYFDAAGQTEPAHDPGENGICPVCGERIGDRPRLCRDLMASMQRSYFFSYHADCKDADKLDAIEVLVVDEIFDWDEASSIAK